MREEIKIELREGALNWNIREATQRRKHKAKETDERDLLSDTKRESSMGEEKRWQGI